MRANWLPGDRFWYRNQTATGSEFVLVDAAKATKAPAFDHAAVATALTTAMGKPVTAARLPFQQITFAADLQSFWFDSDLKRWTCDVQGKQCSGADRPRAGRQQRAVARRQARRVHPRLQPLGPRRRDRHRHSSSRPTASRTSATPPTTPAGRCSDRPVLKWSPDSKKIATFQQDQRKAGEMYLVNTTVGPSDAAGLEVPAARRRRTSP